MDLGVNSPDGDGVSGTTTLTVVDDAVAEGNQTISLYASAPDGSGYAPSDTVTLTLIDDDVPGVTVTPTSLGLIEGSSGTYQVRLDTQPTASVSVSIVSSDKDVVTVTPSSLTFTGGTEDEMGNWNQFQTVTVEAVHDHNHTDESATITHTVTTTSDMDYAGIAIDSVLVSVTDLVPDVTVTPPRLSITEGNSGTYQIRLDARPTAEVTITIGSSDHDVVTVAPASLSFSTATGVDGGWDQFQTVTVTAVHDDDTSDGSATITHTADSSDTNYVREASRNPSVSVRVNDDDEPVQPPKPTITSFKPTSGPAGTSVTINGTYLSGATRVYFNSFAAAASFTVVSSTEIQATVPTGATTGQILVFAPGGEASSPSSFTVLPLVTGVSTTSGPPRTKVTITGAGFGSGLGTVSFGGASQTGFFEWTSTKIRTVVPTGANSGPVVVTANGNSSNTNVNFTVTPTAEGSISVSDSQSSTCTIAETAMTCSIDLTWKAENTDQVQVRLTASPFLGVSPTILFTGGGTKGKVTATIERNSYSVSLWDVTSGRVSGLLDSLFIAAE